MAQYVVFTRLTTTGAESIKRNPQRMVEVRRQVERLGAKISAQYSTLGAYDFVTIVEAPDNEAVMRIVSEISTLGTMKTQISPVIALDRFTQLLKIKPYRTEPHVWQTALWARAIRRAGRYWTSTRYVKRYCQPLSVEGHDNLQGVKGPAIVIANHSSHLDSPVVLHALPERIRGKIAAAAAADKFYASRRRRTWWYSLFQNTFPVHRGGGAKQLEYPMSLLQRGWSILIYPEGGRSKNGQVQRFKAGPAIMAMQARVPVIPIYIEGLRAVMPKGQREPRPAPVHVRIGKVVTLEGMASVQEGTVVLENALRELAGLAPHHAPAPAEADLAPVPAGGAS